MELDYCFIDKRDREFAEPGAGEKNFINSTDYNFDYESSRAVPSRMQMPSDRHYPKLPYPNHVPGTEQLPLRSDIYSNTGMTSAVEKVLEKFTENSTPNPCIYARQTEFWLINPLEIFNEIYVVPTSKMTLNQKLNALVRGSALLSTGLWLLNGNRRVFYIMIIAMLLSVFLFYSKDFCKNFHPENQIAEETRLNVIQRRIRNAKLENKDTLTHSDIKKINTVTKSDNPVTLTETVELTKTAVLNNATVTPGPSPIPGTSPSTGTMNNAKGTKNTLFNIPEDFDYTRENADPFDQKLFCGIDQRVENEMRDRNELLLSYGDHLDFDFGKYLTSDFHGDSRDARAYRSEGSWLVDRDIYHPKNADLFFNPW